MSYNVKKTGVNDADNKNSIHRSDEDNKSIIKSHFDTLGFRGQALYSLATMSHVDVLTM